MSGRKSFQEEETAGGKPRGWCKPGLVFWQRRNGRVTEVEWTKDKEAGNEVRRMARGQILPGFDDHGKNLHLEMSVLESHSRAWSGEWPCLIYPTKITLAFVVGMDSSKNKVRDW